jgi:hypothetical protein
MCEINKMQEQTNKHKYPTRNSYYSQSETWYGYDSVIYNCSERYQVCEGQRNLEFINRCIYCTYITPTNNPFHHLSLLSTPSTRKCYSNAFRIRRSGRHVVLIVCHKRSLTTMTTTNIRWQRSPPCLEP